MTQRTAKPKPQRLAIEFHRKAPGTSIESLGALAGIVVLKGPVPSTKFLEDEEQR